MCMVSQLLWHLHVSVLGAFQWQRLGVLRTLSQPRRQGSASGRHSCCHAVRVVTLAAKISFLVGRFSFPVPLLAFFFFFASPFLVTASSCLLGQQLACLLAAFHLPLCKRALCSVTSHQPCPKHPAFQHTILAGPPCAPQPLWEAHSISQWLPVSAASQCFSPSLRRCGIKREEAFAFVLGGYLRLPVA